MTAFLFLHLNFVSFYSCKSLVNHIYLNFDFFSLNDESLSLIYVFYMGIIQPIHIQLIHRIESILQLLLPPCPNLLCCLK